MQEQAASKRNTGSSGISQRQRQEKARCVTGSGDTATICGSMETGFVCERGLKELMGMISARIGRAQYPLPEHKFDVA
jgi:hypothetical protein